MNPSSLRAGLRSDIVEFCWSQWTQIGVFASVDRVDRWSIDLEALILFTRGVTEEDPRLSEVSAEWVESNEKLVNRRRMQRLERPLPDVGDKPGEATTANHARRLRRIKDTSTSTAPDLSLPVNLTFRLRNLLGNGTRAEIIRILLGVPSPFKLPAREIADLAAYSKRNIQEALNALASAKVIASERDGIRKEVYSLDRQSWAEFLDLDFASLPATMFWPHLLRATLWADRHLGRMEELEAGSEYLKASLAGDFLTSRREDLATIGLPRPARLTIEAFASVFTHDLEAVRSVLRGTPSRRGLGGALRT